MFQWLKKWKDQDTFKVSLPAGVDSTVLASLPDVLWSQIGPVFDDESAALEWAKSDLRGVSSGDELILTTAVARARLGLVVEPLSARLYAAPETAAAPAAAPAAEKRSRKLQAVATPAGEPAGDPATTTTEAPAVTVGAVAGPDAVTVAAGASAAELPEGITADDVGDRIPLPVARPELPAAPAVDPAVQLAEHVAPVLTPTAPFVKLDGVKVRVFDGASHFWQNFATPNGAERAARAFQELIDAGTEPGKFAAVTIQLRKGVAPAD